MEQQIHIHLSMLCKKFGDLHLAEVGLIAGWQADKI